MNKFREWYVRNQDEITWFIIGWMSLAVIDDLVAHNYIWAAINFVILYINYQLRIARLS